MTRVRLRELVTEQDRTSVLGLRLGPGQDRYLNSIESIFVEAEQDRRAMPRQWAVHDAESGELVGFTMISDGIPAPIDDDLVGWGENVLALDLGTVTCPKSISFPDR